MTCLPSRPKNDSRKRRFFAGRKACISGHRLASQILSIALLLLFLPALAHADENTQRRVANIFQPVSAPAQQIYHVAVLVLIICAGIFFVVGGILVYTIIRFRKRADDDGREPPQVYGGTQIELAWTVLPILITLVLIAITARTIGEIQNAKMPDSAIKVRVVGHQWWWEIHYPDYGIVTANELHVPLSAVNRRLPTHITLQSADVAHSFWVPQLAGKTDLIPNRDNETWIEPYETGTFFGNCSQYCGTQHANMLLRVIVHTPEDFQKWVANQKKAAVNDPLAAQGKALFYSLACINCHTIDGTIAKGGFGPDLTHLMSRQTIGAGVADLTPTTLHEWIQNPQTLKPGCLMPDMKLLGPQVDQVTAYLQTLK
ncbi:MAG: cytochrome c oxidase subunit II [Chthoniobacterales bacterium]